MDDNKITNLIDEIKEFRKELKEKGNGDLSKISTKDLLFFFLNKFSDVDKRMDDIEKEQVGIKTTIRNVIVFVSLTVSCLAILGYFGL